MMIVLLIPQPLLTGCAHIFTGVHWCVLWLGNIKLIGLPVSAVRDREPLNHICLRHLLASPRIYGFLLRPVLSFLATVQRQPLLPTARSPACSFYSHGLNWRAGVPHMHATSP